MPGPHPAPPGDLAERSLPIRTIARGETWIRIHRLTHHPLHFGRSGSGRFDAPKGQYGVLYVAGDLYAAFVETFGRDPAQNVVAWRDLRERAVSLMEVVRPLRLIDLSGSGLRQVGADARLCSTEDYRLAQQWAWHLWQHPEQPDGLLWRCRLDPSRLSLALYDRAQDAIRAALLGRLIDQPELGDVLETYKFALL
ncbi:MAG: RES family NAD+ phosphorylase [Acidobacteria bacterium]|nr:RES family NAD+ phosphorylase [Acidobacteriota bacterium]